MYTCWVKLYFVHLKNSKGLPQVLDVLLILEALHQYVINVHIYSVADFLFEHFVTSLW